MIKVSVLYPNADGVTFDIDYYCATHLPLAQSLIGAPLKGVSAELGIPGQGPYIAMGHLLFESVEDFQAALAAHGPALLADIPNYTNTRPIFQVGEIKL